ncbi:PAP_fibrillin [Hyella patelloides LEGE 07179]|uniref:PAP_fibrillin n=1 Tax=Hyella patelloides LEGE 07179 TaxID=945734 RepID=A0A563VPG4_9CYAN|nr:PAP/fibrillin family protein [Hyella patelloides]VEP13300.1 PAP_fibrillin [Hyella patelloides LEGE 07179]
MQEIPNRLTIKQNLISEIEELKSQTSTLVDSPITDLEIQPQKVQLISSLTQALEKFNPFPRPLLYASNLLDGIWLLQYSTAREIRSLKRLPLGFLVGKIYQIIDINHASFENKAWVQHSFGLLSGYVRVTATFEPSKQGDDQLPNQKINIDFQQRFLGINQILGIKTDLLDPIRVVEAKNPTGRIPSLNLTYIDATMRIGRGGDGSLFILTRA